MAITIRLAIPADALEMAEIHARSWEVAYKDIIPMEYIKAKNATRLALFKKIITADNHRQYVIQTDGKTVGIMCVDTPQEDDVEVINDNGIDDSFYELHGIYLHPEFYRNGFDSFKSHITKNEKVTITQGNATDFTYFTNNAYDITLLLGPMYHMFTKDEQKKALSEAIRVTKQGGIVFVAYCMGDASVLSYGFIRGHIHEIIDKCMLNTDTFETFSQPWDIFELYRKEDIDSLRNNFNVSQLHFVASDGYANHMRETLANMDEDTFQLYLKYHFATCERQDMIGLSHHTLDIFRKD